MTAERWVPLPGFGDHYQVSTHGRVRSLPRTTTSKTGVTRSWPGQVLAACDDGRGYPYVHLTVAGRPYVRKVHTLVALAFHGPCPDGQEVRHRNGDRSDARPENLEYGTHRQNVHDMIGHGRHANINKVACNRGHQLRGANLVPSGIPRGRRQCTSCHRAAAAHQRHVAAGRTPWTAEEHQAVSDRHYAQILGTEGGE